MEFQLSFQILNDDAVKVLYSICQQIWKTQQWPQDWKRSVFIPSQRNPISKNAQTTAQLHSSQSVSSVTQSCPTLATPWTVAHQAPPSMGFSRHEYWSGLLLYGILQARTLEWVAFPFSRGSSKLRNRTRVSCIAGGFFYQLSYQGSRGTKEVIK